MKGNANPTIVKVNHIRRGNSINVVGRKLKDVLPLLKRQMLDAMVEVEVKRRDYRGKNLFDIWIGQGSDPNINRDRMMDSWMA